MSATELVWLFRSLSRARAYVVGFVVVLAIGLAAGTTLIAAKRSVAGVPLPFEETER